MRRVLVTGAGGQLGRDLLEAFTGWDVIGADHGALAVEDRDAVLSLVTSLRPDVVVHAAAWTAVDACEGDPRRAFLTNALGTRWVAEAARRCGARVVYISTDYVFDGTKDAPYHEWDRTNPLSVYGQSKLAGERELDPGSTIVRTSWVCGRHGSNIVKTILRLAAGDGPLRFVDDQRGNPTFTPDLAVAVRELASRDLAGTFHVTNTGTVSWFELARDVVALAGHDPDRVEPVATADLDPPRPAPRPRNSALANEALLAAGLEPLPDYRESLARLVRQLEDQ